MDKTGKEIHLKALKSLRGSQVEGIGSNRRENFKKGINNLCLLFTLAVGSYGL
jgi:hypothetical protein